MSNFVLIPTYRIVELGSVAPDYIDGAVTAIDTFARAKALESETSVSAINAALTILDQRVGNIELQGVGGGEGGVVAIPGPKGDKGDQGDPGEKGDTGDPGQTAYQLAVASGYVGSQASWLASLVGPAGQNGQNGLNGQDGTNGVAGADGQDGQSVTITVVADQTAYDAATPGPLELVVLYAQA